MVISWLKKLAQPQGKGERADVGLNARAAVEVTREAIARRAYEKWVARGRPEGTSTQDWLEAEAELRGESRTMNAR